MQRPFKLNFLNLTFKFKFQTIITLSSLMGKINFFMNIVSWGYEFIKKVDLYDIDALNPSIVPCDTSSKFYRVKKYTQHFYWNTLQNINTKKICLKKKKLL